MILNRMNVKARIVQMVPYQNLIIWGSPPGRWDSNFGSSWQWWYEEMKSDFVSDCHFPIKWQQLSSTGNFHARALHQEASQGRKTMIRLPRDVPFHSCFQDNSTSLWRTWYQFCSSFLNPNIKRGFTQTITTKYSRLGFSSPLTRKRSTTTWSTPTRPGRSTVYQINFHCPAQAHLLIWLPVYPTAFDHEFGKIN